MAKMLALLAVTTALILNVTPSLSGLIEKEKAENLKKIQQTDVVSKKTIPVTKRLTASGKLSNPYTNSTHRNKFANPMTGRVQVKVQSSISRNMQDKNVTVGHERSNTELQVNLMEPFRPYFTDPGDNCWEPCGRKAGYCADYCGKNGFCCVESAQGSCPDEIRNVALRNKYLCVSLGTAEPYKVDEKDCWTHCGKKGGPCNNFCGTNGYCCRGSRKDCPLRMSRIADRDYHKCYRDEADMYLGGEYDLSPTAVEEDEDRCTIVHQNRQKPGRAKLSEIFSEYALTLLKEQTKGFVHGDDWVEKMIYDNCKEEKLISIDLHKDRDFNPVDWFLLPAGDKVYEYELVFNWHTHMDTEKPLNVKLWSKGILQAKGSDYYYELRRNIPFREYETTGYVYLDIHRNKMTALEFMQFINIEMGLDALFPRKNNIPSLERNIHDWTYPGAALTFIPTGRNNKYSVFMKSTYYHSVKYSHNSLGNTIIFCKRDFLKKNCALLEIVTRTSPITRLVPGMDIANMATALELFPNKRFPDKIFFQSAKEEIDDVSELPWYEDVIKYVTINDNREDNSTNNGGNIIPATCFRYRYDGMHNNKDVRVNMCPTENSYRFSFPDLVPLSAKKIVSLVHGTELPEESSISNWLQRTAIQNTLIDFVEVSPSSDSGAYKILICMKPQMTNGSNTGFKLLPNLKFIQIKNSTIDIEINGNTFKIIGSGEEKIIGHKATFVIRTEGDESKVTFTLNTTSNRLLMSGIKEESAYIGANEADLNGYITPFEALENITLNTVVLDTDLLADRFTFVSNAKIGSLSDVKFQLELRKLQTASCVYKENGGQIAPFLKSIQGKTFFGQSWLGYEKIGIIMSSTPLGISNKICHNRDISWAERFYYNFGMSVFPKPVTPISRIDVDYVISLDFYVTSKEIGNNTIDIPMLKFKRDGDEKHDLPEITFQQDTNGTDFLTICRGETCWPTNITDQLDKWNSVRITQAYSNTSHVNFTIYINGLQHSQIQLRSDTLQSYKDLQVTIALKRVYTRNIIIREYPKKVGVKISNLNFDCEIKGKGEGGVEVVDRKKGCQFMKRIFPTDKKVTTELDGWMNSTDMFLSGETTQVLVLGRSVKISGSEDTIRVILKVQPNNTDGSILDFLRFEGRLKLDGAPDTYPAILIVSGDVIKFRIARIAVESIPSIPLYQRTNFNVWIKPRGRISVVYNQSMDIVEMRAPLFIGTKMDAEQPIQIATASLMREYVDPVSPLSNSKFYACKDRTRDLKIKKLLRKISSRFVNGFLDDSTVRHLCIAFNNGDTAWKVPSIGETFEKGISFTGKIKTNFGNGGKNLSLPLHVSFAPEGTMDFCTRLPVQKWGAQLGTASEDIDDENLAEVPNTEEENENKDVADTKVEDEKEGKLIITKKYMCDLTDEFGVDFDPSSSTHFRGEDADGCVTKCIKLCEDDPNVNGIVMKGTGDDSDCWCAKNMEYSTANSPEYKTCILQGIGQHAIQMHLGEGKQKEAFGPKMCYQIPTDSGARVSAYMTGYLKTFAFEIPEARFEITALRKNDQLSNMDWVKDDVLIFNEVYGRVELQNEGSKLPRDPSKINFRIKITFSNFRRNRTQILEELANRCNLDKMIFEKHKSKFEKHERKFRKWYNTENRALQDFMRSTQSLRRSFNQDSINRARAMNSYSRQCSRECGFVKIPGWTVDEGCHSNKDGQSMSCMKYKRDANYACNVGCVANCEAERVKSFIEAKQLHARTVISGSNLDLKEQCEQKGKAYVQKLNDSMQLATENKNAANAKMEHFDRIKAANQGLAELINNLVAETTSRKLTDPRCLRYTFQFRDNVYSNTKICFNGFLKNLVKKLYKQLHNEREKKATSHTFEGDSANMEQILKRDDENVEYRKIQHLKEEFEKCSSDKTKKAEKVGRMVRSLRKLRDGDFTKFEDDTMESFNEKSPWEVAKKMDIKHEMLKLKKTQVPAQMQNRTSSKDDDACSVARRASIEYKDIASYILKWSEVQNGAKRTLKNLHKTLKIEESKDIINSPFFEKNYTTAEKAEMKFWINRATDGMKKWVEIEDEQMKQYNTESLPFIRKQLEFMYAGNNNKNISDFLLHRSVDGTNALKRASIQTESPSQFSYLYKDLANILSSGRNLDEISERITDIWKRTDVLAKRTISCTV